MRSKKYIVYLIIGFVHLAMVATAQNETYQWGNVAIGGGGFVSGIITSKAEQGLIYARTDVGGAYRWDAANSRWIPLLDWTSESEMGYQGVESIAIDPVEPNKVYMLVGTSYFNGGKTAILRSSDYGNTFSITEVSSQFKAHGNGMGRQSGEKLVVDPNSNNILYCGSRANGLFKSSNSGSTWNRVSSLDINATPNENGISFVILDAASGSEDLATQTIIAGISRGSQTGPNMYRSDNAGGTFSAITGGPTNTALMPHRATLASDGNLFITYVNAAGPWDISGVGQIWKYNLQSGVWTNVSPAAFPKPFGGISVDPNDPQRLVASSLNTYMAQGNTWGERIFLSTNGGSSWTDVIDRGFQLDAKGSPWIDGHSIHWAGSIEFDPFDTQKVWVISGNGIFLTNNIDATTCIWIFQVDGLEETVPLDIFSIANGPLVSVIGDYDGFRHTDVTQYAPIHSPRMGTTTGLAVAAQNPNIMMRTGQKNVDGNDVGQIYYSEDMGISWTGVDSKGVKGSVAISADGTTFLHCPEGSPQTYYSTDLGITWTESSGIVISGARPVADPIHKNKFYAYDNNSGNLMVSTNKGLSFAHAGSAGSGGSKVIRTVPGREGDIWIPLYQNGLTRSINSGQSFSKISAVSQCSAVGFGKEAPGKNFPTIYIWGTVSGVLGIHRSTDEGQTWLRINDDAHEYGGPGNGQFVVGDMNVFGRVYMSSVGRGIIYGESSNTCLPTQIVPKIAIDGGAFLPTNYLNVSVANDVLLSPTADGNGTWKWIGPNNFSSTDREVSLENIQPNQAGIYSVWYTNEQGCESGIQTFTIQTLVLTESIIVTGEGGIYTLQPDSSIQMLAEINPSTASEQSVLWSISSGQELASISIDGILTAFSEEGPVVVKAESIDGSNVFAETEVLIERVLGIAQPSNSYLLFPNPVQGDLTVNNTQQVHRLLLLDTAGRNLKSTINADHSESVSIDLTGTKSGLYFLKIIRDDGNESIKKIIKE